MNEGYDNEMLANVALPAFFPHSLATLLGLFVIATIEGWFLMRTLELRFRESFGPALNANLMSTIAGIPLAWVLWVAGLVPVATGLSALGVEAPPAVHRTLVHTVLTGGMKPNEWTNVGSAAAWIILLVPFWFGSVWIEKRAIKKRLPACDASRISRAVVRGNLVSYGLFLAIGLIALGGALTDLPHQKSRYKELRERKNRPSEAGGGVGSADAIR